MNPEDQNIDIARLWKTLQQLVDTVAQVVAKDRNPLTAAGTKLGILGIERLHFRFDGRLTRECLRVANRSKRIVPFQKPGLAGTGQTGHGERMGWVFEPRHGLGPARLHFFVSGTLALFYVFSVDAKHFRRPGLFSGKYERS